jgi:hypothetical protein
LFEEMRRIDLLWEIVKYTASLLWIFINVYEFCCLKTWTVFLFNEALSFISYRLIWEKIWNVKANKLIWRLNWNYLTRYTIARVRIRARTRVRIRARTRARTRVRTRVKTRVKDSIKKMRKYRELPLPNVFIS